MIPDAAVEAAAASLCGVTPEAWESQATHTKDTYRWKAIAALEAAAPHMLAPALALADEMDNVHGSIRGHVTTYQLRQALGVKY